MKFAQHNFFQEPKLALSKALVYLTLKAAGGGRIQPIGQEIACHFSQDHTMVPKFLDFMHKHPK